MNYQKPQVVLVEAAMTAIQGMDKTSDPHPDAPINFTDAVYLADE